jgi:hypothetical protein
MTWTVKMKWRLPVIVSALGPGVIYIGRAGRGQSGLFGNPVRIGRPCPVCSRVHPDAADTLPCFRVYFRRRIAADPQFRQAVLALAGRRLWCPGCRGHHLCHGQVIRTWFATGCPVTWSE